MALALDKPNGLAKAFGSYDLAFVVANKAVRRKDLHLAKLGSVSLLHVLQGRLDDGRNDANIGVYVRRNADNVAKADLENRNALNFLASRLGQRVDSDNMARAREGGDNFAGRGDNVDIVRRQIDNFHAHSLPRGRHMATHTMVW
ncbi:MAG: hypothetical protein D6698_16880 [Gammaproteobacteria bacterium]|nr:MAG: hypothetical protein D6698_16880 [Gammaproteobacteria bacterium]